MDHDLERNVLDLPALRLIVSCGRSGSSALLRTLAGHPRVHALYQPIKAGFRETGVADHRIYRQHPWFVGHPPQTIFVAKELTTHDFALFRGPSDVARTRPVFLLRAPRATWESFSRVVAPLADDWHERFVFAYERTLAEYRAARRRQPRAVLPVTHEDLVAAPATVVRRICRHWALPFDPQMLRWSSAWDASTSLGDAERRMLREHPQWIDSMVHSTSIDARAQRAASCEPTPRAAKDLARLRLHYRRFATECDRVHQRSATPPSLRPVAAV